MASVTDEPRIASFMTADHAEAINGKLYVMGGGFDNMAAPTYPWDVRFAIAALLMVPWNDTNRRFPISGMTESVDGDELGWKMEGEIEAGRAPGKRGGDTTIALAAPVGFRAEEPLNFIVKLRFAGDERPLQVSLLPPPFPSPPGAQTPPTD